MRFEITRTSEYHFKPPTPSALPSDHMYPNPDAKDYYVDINSLEQLMNLVDLEGTLVLDKDSIEIYDDYHCIRCNAYYANLPSCFRCRSPFCPKCREYQCSVCVRCSYEN